MPVIKVDHFGLSTQVTDHLGGTCMLKYNVMYGWRVLETTGDFVDRVSDIVSLTTARKIAIETAVKAVETGQTTRLDLHTLAFAVKNSEFNEPDGLINYRDQWLSELAMLKLSFNTHYPSFEQNEKVKLLMPAVSYVAVLAEQFGRPESVELLMKRLGFKASVEQGRTLAALLTAVTDDIFTLLPLKDFVEENTSWLNSIVDSVRILAELLIPVATSVN